MALLAVLALASGCTSFGPMVKRQSELNCPTDVRQTVPWCAGEDAIFRCPCGPDGQFYGHRPTGWRCWPASATVWREAYCAGPVICEDAGTIVPGPAQVQPLPAVEEPEPIPQGDEMQLPALPPLPPAVRSAPPATPATPATPAPARVSDAQSAISRFRQAAKLPAASFQAGASLASHVTPSPDDGAADATAEATSESTNSTLHQADYTEAPSPDGGSALRDKQNAPTAIGPTADENASRSTSENVLRFVAPASH